MSINKYTSSSSLEVKGWNKLLKSTSFLSIGEVAKQCGMRPSALRYYESIGLLPAPGRSGGQRRYEAGVLSQISFIQAARKTGFSIKEILTLLHDTNSGTPYAKRVQVLAWQKLAEVEAQIVHAHAMKQILEAGLVCRCAAPEECLLFRP